MDDRPSRTVGSSPPDSVVAGARRTEELEPLVAQYGGRRSYSLMMDRLAASELSAIKILNLCIFSLPAG
jgi:hypothetical protein